MLSADEADASWRARSQRCGTYRPLCYIITSRFLANTDSERMLRFTIDRVHHDEELMFPVIFLERRDGC